MIRQETVGNLTYTYSDKYHLIQREDGTVFATAYDVEPHSYTETEDRLYTDEEIDMIATHDAEEAERIRRAYA